MRRRIEPCSLNTITHQPTGEIAMKMTEIIAHPLSVALAQGRWTAHEFMDRAQLVLVEVRTDQGIVGFGEIAGGPQTVVCDLVKMFSPAWSRGWTRLATLRSGRSSFH
jgi:hypothetical protein